MPHSTKKEKQTISSDKACFQEGALISFSGQANNETQQFSMVANTGKVMDHWFWGKLIIDLEGAQLPKKNIPVLRDHQTDKIVGWTNKIMKSAENGISVIGNISKTTEDGKEVEGLSEEGFPWQASVYMPPSSIEEVEEGVMVEVNDMSLKGPLTIFRKSKLKEVSFCALGTDDNTEALLLKDKTEEIVIEKITNGGGKKMELTIDKLKADHPEIVAELTREAEKEVIEKVNIRDKAFEEDVNALRNEERDRIVSILGQVYGEEEKEKLEKVLNPHASIADIMAFATNKAKQDILSEMQRLSPESLGGGSESENENNTILSTNEEQMKAKFSQDPVLQAEFGTVERYVAFTKAENDGRIRILKSKEA